jgi:CubicO group peptidase (beta-lactamase class C family)
MDFQKITDYLKSLEEYGVPSTDMMIYKDHELIYRNFNGFTDENKSVTVSDDTQYLMFSMTKVQTMTALMQLVERGVLSLDDEASKYLPAYKELTAIDNNSIVKVNSLKLWQLASMQSGLDYDLERPGIVRVLKEKGASATTKELVDSFVESPLSFIPGTHYQYSLSHDVIAAVIEVASGMKFSEYLKKNIWEPLGMNRTYFAKPINNDGPVAKQYIYNEPANKVEPMEQSCCYQLSENYESGGAGLTSCTKDYAILGDTLACGGISKDGVRILKPETVEVFKKNLLCEASMREIDANMGRKGYGYGVGMQILLNPALISSPAPAGIFGWDGAAGSCIQMDTASKTSFVFTMHVRGFGPAYGIIHPKLRDLVFGK